MTTIEQFPAEQPPTDPATPVRVTLRGLRSSSLRGYAQRKVGHVVESVGQHPQDVRVVITSTANPALARPVTVEVDILVDGHRVRMHTSAATPREAVDLVTHGLRRQLVETGQRQVARARGDRARRSPPPADVNPD